MRAQTLFWAVVLAAVARAGEPAPAGATVLPSHPSWTISLQGGFASTFQMTLGGTFGEGPAFQNRLSASMNNALKAGDSLTIFGSHITDLPSETPNWQAGVMYSAPVIRTPRHVVRLGGGIQRWLLPSVKSGAQDWVAAGLVNYETKIKGVPLVVSQDYWGLLRSTLPKGSEVYTQVYTQHGLLKREAFRLLLRQGPQYTYSWGFYGTHGNRVMRYGGSLVLVWKGRTTFDCGYRQQFGLQDGIPDNRFWSFLVTRQFSGSFLH